jgi:hypothetical protein
VRVTHFWRRRDASGSEAVSRQNEKEGKNAEIFLFI